MPDTPPAGMSEISQQGVSLKPDVLYFPKGVFTNTRDSVCPPGYARVLDNVHMFQDGVWSPKFAGWEDQRLGGGSMGGSFVEMYTHQETAPRYHGLQTTEYILQIGNTVYTYDGTTLTDITGSSGASASAIPCMRDSSQGLLIYCNGVVDPSSYYFAYGALVNLNPVGGWPPTVGAVTYTAPAYFENYYQRYVWSGFDAHPYTILLSNPGQDSFVVSAPPVATDAGAIDMPSVLGPITGMAPIRVGNGSNDQALLIGCTHGMGLLKGSDATNFATVGLTQAYGVPNNRTWCYVNDSIFFMATDGIRQISNSSYGANLVHSLVSWPVQDLIRRINCNHWDQMFAVNNYARQECEFWIPIDSDTTCKNAIVMNYRNIDQGLVWSTKSSIQGNCGMNVIELDHSNVLYQGMWIGGTSGILQTWSGASGHNNVSMPWRILSGLINSNSYAQNMSNKKFIIVTDGDIQNFNWEVWGNVQSAGKDIWTLRKLLGNGVLSNASLVGSPVDTSCLDLSTWNWDGVTATFPNRQWLLEFATMGSGRSMLVHLYGIAGTPIDELYDTIDLVGIQPVDIVGGWKQ